MKFFRNIVLAAVCAMVLGCASEGQKPTRIILVDSTPQGAQVIVNSFAIAKTPVSVEVEATEDGYFVKRTQITAVAQSPDLFTQVASYPPYSPSNPAISEIPEKITFDMTTSAAAQEKAKEAK